MLQQGIEKNVGEKNCTDWPILGEGKEKKLLQMKAVLYNKVS